MPKHTVTKDGKKVFGPYKGSKQNGGRPMMVIKDKNNKATSTSKARYEFEKRNGKLPRSVDVDHKDNGGRAGRDHAGNLRAMSHSANVAKENKRRAKPKTTTTKPKKAPTRAKKRP